MGPRACVASTLPAEPSSQLPPPLYFEIGFQDIIVRGLGLVLYTRLTLDSRRAADSVSQVQGLKSSHIPAYLAPTMYFEIGLSWPGDPQNGQVGGLLFTSAQYFF